MSPPFGADEKVQAIHVLNVLDCAKVLAAAVAQAGGIEKLDVKNVGVRDALTTLFEQTSKLQVYEARARARGTVGSLTDETLTMAVKELRDKRVLTADEEDVRDATPAQIEAAFSLDEPEDAPPPVAPDAPDAPAPDSGTIETKDAFSL